MLFTSCSSAGGDSGRHLWLALGSLVQSLLSVIILFSSEQLHHFAQSISLNWNSCFVDIVIFSFFKFVISEPILCMQIFPHNFIILGLILYTRSLSHPGDAPAALFGWWWRLALISRLLTQLSLWMVRGQSTRTYPDSPARVRFSIVHTTVFGKEKILLDLPIFWCKMRLSAVTLYVGFRGFRCPRPRIKGFKWRRPKVLFFSLFFNWDIILWLSFFFMKIDFKQRVPIFMSTHPFKKVGSSRGSRREGKMVPLPVEQPEGCPGHSLHVWLPKVTSVSWTKREK